ncbi:hypothetical protein PHYC_03855 [Phycisphaerales bacterium]|nr:hypothetical protein PHYC_03855 [Phycisphaerales bacterium]
MKRSMMTAAAAAILGLSMATSAFGQQSNAAAYEKLVTEHAAANVNVKFILKAEGQEQESEIPGVMIEKTGLVLASTMGLGEMDSRFGGVAISPTQIKVLIGEDTQGIDAKMIARDSDLALGWFQIEKADEKGYAFLDFAQGAPAVGGDTLMVVSQMGKFFHRANVVTEGKVACVTSKPRRLLIPSISLVTADFGVPVFDAQSRPVGLFTAVLPDKDEYQSSPRVLNEIQQSVPGFKMIVPADEIVAATKRAKETAASNPPAAPEAPADEKPGETPGSPAAPK